MNAKTEEEFARELRRLAPAAPPPPAGEWAALAARLAQSQPWWRRWRSWTFASGLGLALAGGAWLLVLPSFPPADEEAALEAWLGQAGASLDGADAEASALLDTLAGSAAEEPAADPASSRG